MKQVVQNFKSGALKVDEVPPPILAEKMVLVENRFSLISAGTERGTVKVAKANLIGKARQRPDLVAQVFQNIKKEGIKATINKVQTKLDSPKALGYSTAGIVHASLDSYQIFKPGDRVACAGQDYASHAEFVSVPQNLVAKIPDGVSFQEASYTTVGAIALQGVRQADPKLGENVCVIGLGLLGQITCQLLKVNGCNVFGIDLEQHFVDLAGKVSADKAANRKDANLMSLLDDFVQGKGFDSVIIAAATSSNDPVELATEILRKKGIIVVVGAVNMNIPREPHFYKKELELKISCSYGPGRYDPKYEESGIDYPYSYVRWTEQRNMEAFLTILAKGKLDLKSLTSHIFPIDKAEKAYDIVLGKETERAVGILLEYPQRAEKFSGKINVNTSPVADINVGFIGAGSFAQNYLIPHVKSAGATLDTVVTSKGITSKSACEKFGFNTASTDIRDVIGNSKINTVFIATRHNTHAELVAEALQAGKHVFVEKPLALNVDELNKIQETISDCDDVYLMVGFNRRFSPLANKAVEFFKNIGSPLAMNFRINAGKIDDDSWIQDPAIGGGRIIGEICHFVDLMQFLTGAKPFRVHAESLQLEKQSLSNQDNLSITLRFEDGSIGNIAYFSNGDKALPKEYLEIFGGGKIFIIDDFKTGRSFSGHKEKKHKLSGKGHQEEINAFLSLVEGSKTGAPSFESMYLTTLTTFKIHDALSTGLSQTIS